MPLAFSTLKLGATAVRSDSRVACSWSTRSSAMALTAIRLIENPGRLDEARDELMARRGGQPYRCPIPPEVALPFART